MNVTVDKNIESVKIFDEQVRLCAEEANTVLEGDIKSNHFDMFGEDYENAICNSGENGKRYRCVKSGDKFKWINDTDNRPKDIKENIPELPANALWVYPFKEKGYCIADPLR